MKTIMTIAAVAFMATAANAQTMTPADPANNPSSMTATPPADSAAPAPAPGAVTGELVERNGKWWNGDREATKTEIAEYKKAKKAGRPS
jgi:hypothetical protein